MLPRSLLTQVGKLRKQRIDYGKVIDCLSNLQGRKEGWQIQKIMML